MVAERRIEGKTSVSSKGQVVLPKAVRDRLGWREGDTLAVEVDNDDRVVLRRDVPERIDPAIARQVADRWAGSLARLRRGKPPLTDDEMHRMVEAAAAEADARTKTKRRSR